ncbi:hypothetical protein LCGC14_0568710 [marine sediment metagenome]|uniref:Uncharacterized protein n=1 Tax=marine sediment metagenome TaxID=412755 RepID=A0A0F9RJV2_9ZZZZ|nr:hypothetical protein [Phycisphaerae bacterium]
MTAPPSMTLMDAVRSIVSHCPTDEARAAINWYDALIDRLQAAEQALLSRPDRPVRSQDFLDGIHEAIRVYRTAAEAAAKGAQT